MSWIRVLKYVVWFVIAGCFVAVLIQGGYTSATRIVHGIGLGAAGVLLPCLSRSRAGEHGRPRARPNEADAT